MNASFRAPVPCPVLPSLVWKANATWLGFFLPLGPSSIGLSVHLILHYPLCSPLGLTAFRIASPGRLCSSPWLYTLPLPTAFEVCKIHKPKNQKEHDAGPASPTQGSSSPLTASPHLLLFPHPPWALPHLSHQPCFPPSLPFTSPWDPRP